MSSTSYGPRNIFRAMLLLGAVLLVAGCSGGTDLDGAAGDDAIWKAEVAEHAAQAQQDVVAAPARFEGTIRQLTISLDADAIRSIAGSNDLATVLALPAGRVIEAVQEGELHAQSIYNATLEIDGRMGRLQTDGDRIYTVLDGDAMVVRVVDPDNRMILTMDPEAMAAAAVAGGKDAQPMDLDPEHIGQREIRGFDTDGYRFDFFDNVATVWLSEDLEARIGPVFDIWAAANPLGRFELGEGAPVRSVVVNPEALAGGGGFMPAYTVTDFYQLEPGDIADDRFALPEGYQQQGMADLGRGAK